MQQPVSSPGAGPHLDLPPPLSGSLLQLGQLPGLQPCVRQPTACCMHCNNTAGHRRCESGGQHDIHGALHVEECAGGR